MFGAVVRAEWRSALRERFLWPMLALFAAFALYGAIGGARFVQAEHAAIAQAEQEERERFERLRTEASRGSSRAVPASDPALVGRELLPRTAALPPGPLAALAVGQRDVLPQTALLTTGLQLVDAGHDDGASPTRRALGPFDVGFVIVFLLPLLVIAVSYDLLSVERERGTLALVLSQPVSLTTFVLGKAFQRAMLLVASLVTIFAVAAIVSGVRVTEPGAPLALGLWLALIVCYALFWFALSLAVNAWGLSSAANALSLVAAWLLLVVVIPGLGVVLVDTLYPAPSRPELVNLARDATAEATAKATALEGDHGRQGSAKIDGRRALELQEEIQRRVEPVVRQFQQQLDRQQRLVSRVRFASPALLAHEGVTDVTGSGVARQRHFEQQVQEFHQRLKAFFAERVRAERTLAADDYDAMPDFDYRDEALASVVRRAGSCLLGLLGQSALLVLIALAGLRRNVSRGLR